MGVGRKAYPHYFFMTFPAKLLLFGEHTVLKGSQALAIPFPAFKGFWAFVTQKNDRAQKQQSLPQLLAYLKNLKGKNELEAPLQLHSLERDLQKGLYFESNIPTGYGLGSSGALCAAIYHRYVGDKKNEEFTVLKKQLAQIESFFHGSSSGIDPLIIFLNQAVLIAQDKKITTTAFDKTDEPLSYTYFILDTGISRQTAPFVNVFLEKCHSVTFYNRLQSELNPYTNAAIKNILAGKNKDVFNWMHRISEFQLQYFREMIPSDFIEVWKKGIDRSDFKLKLCGAGGGGFLLGMYEKNSEAEGFLKEAFSVLTFDI